MGCFLLLAFAYIAWRFAGHLCPAAVNVTAGLGRLAVKVLWTKPARHFGAGGAMFLWLIILAVLATFSGVAALAAGQAAGLLAAMFLWAAVAGVWWFIRWRALRRYTPRALPTRRERR